MKRLSALILAGSATFGLWAANQSNTAPAAPTLNESSIAAGILPVEEAAVEPGLLQTGAVRSGSDDIAGGMNSASGAMSFRTTSLQAGKPLPRGGFPDRVHARLEVNGAVIDHEIDYAAETVTIRTDGSVTIDQRDRNILQTFQKEYARQLAAASSAGSLPKAQDFLWRLSEMYSEIPLGMRLPSVRVVRKQTKMEPIDRDGQGMVLDSQSNPILARPTATLPDIIAAACDERAGGGFVNLRDGANVCENDAPFYRNSHHDYCPAHGYIAQNSAYGCGSSGCSGRCGSGCGLDGRGAWYKDCLDHDVCNRTHNSQLGACGDEFNEASDDYLFGTIECALRGCH